MTKRDYNLIVNFMEENMKDVAHDILHVYRVLNQSIIIAKFYEDIDYDVLIAACLLHDIGRSAQFNEPKICHALAGSQMAYQFLVDLGWNDSQCIKVRHCIATHRYRNTALPETIEAKILFDADKLDITGALGIARTLLYKGKVNEPLYAMDKFKNSIYIKEENQPESFIKEYHYKLFKVYDMFFTEEAKKIAQKRKKLTENFYNELLDEIDMEDAERYLKTILQ